MVLNANRLYTRVSNIATFPLHKENLGFFYNKECFMGAKQTWRFRLADGFCLPQPGVPVAGQVTPNHVAFGQKGDENGDRDCCDEDGHQELPVVRDMFLSLVLQSACKREKKKDFRPWSVVIVKKPPCLIVNLDFHSWHCGMHLNSQCLVTPTSNQADQTLSLVSRWLFFTKNDWQD